MKCLKCETEINRLEKRFPWLDFIVSMFIAFLFSLIPFVGWLFAFSIVVVWFAWYSGRKPDRCPVCNQRLRYDSKRKVFVIKHWWD